jgi:hypothetical protein
MSVIEAYIGTLIERAFVNNAAPKGHNLCSLAHELMTLLGFFDGVTAYICMPLFFMGNGTKKVINYQFH